jgi:hypothetical protein
MKITSNVGTAPARRTPGFEPATARRSAPPFASENAIFIRRGRTFRTWAFIVRLLRGKRPLILLVALLCGDDGTTHLC